ncbi:MAG: UDP-3-O-acyl-N-acetylglucosamine deacetylase [Alphaproteobacteria bacterium]|nr:UDP-3-O-acyl-N-acetylglucosamine deacetylase [Alphaproteobacteria bacterium]
MTTLKKNVKLSGRGIHSGLPVNIVVKPSKVPGIFFRRVDMPGSDLIAARFDNVGDTKMRNTTIGNPNGAHVQTIEHLMAALFIAGIDSAIIEIDGKETPILDGSAAIFYDKFSAAAGTKNPMRRIVVRRDVIVHARDVMRTLPLVTRIKIWFFNTIAGRKSNGYVKLSPNDGKSLNITATLVYPEKIIGSQTYKYSFDGSDKSVQTFVNDVARARTFGKYSEWEYLKAHGMGRGADETNVIALNDAGDGTLNKTIWSDEFVRHKVIDALGDMFTSGGMIVGNMVSYKGSHAMNNLVLKKLFSDPNNYDILD